MYFHKIIKTQQLKTFKYKKVFLKKVCVIRFGAKLINFGTLRKPTWHFTLDKLRC